MSLSHAIADAVMREVAVVAPADRADWARAMRAELSAIEGRAAALSWAAGCLATALGWRLWVETFYLGLAVLWFAGPYLYMAVMEVVVRSGLFPHAAWLVPLAAQGLPCLVFAAWRPDRVVLAAVVAFAPVLPFIVLHLVPQLIAGEPDPSALLVLGEIFRMVVIGACLGLAMGDLARRAKVRRVASR